ncbi:FkbM family methyltransferase [Aquirufa sp.]|jgi:FkbM family methyltransferase|uniref:FkbM family methyltransferase n=1 Tax=Aquirufa sp. TaxID=2676249 RepID=UPI0037C034F2
MNNIVKKAILAGIQAFCKLTNTKITIQKLDNKKHPLAASSGESMAIFCDVLLSLTTYNPKNVFEIGANFGQDSEYLRKRFALKPSDIYIFEPHPQIISEAKRIYKFNSFALAVSDKNTKMKFFAIDLMKNSNSGISSLRSHNFNDKDDYKEIEVNCIRMDKFVVENKIQEIDFLKIDVEGANYEVISGFGSELCKVKAIQIEGENIPVWEGQFLFDDISVFLRSNNFELVYFELKDSCQSDSLFIRKDLIKQRYMIQ